MQAQSLVARWSPTRRTHILNPMPSLIAQSRPWWTNTTQFISEHRFERIKVSYHSVHQPRCGVCLKHCKSFWSLSEHVISEILFHMHSDPEYYIFLFLFFESFGASTSYEVFICLYWPFTMNSILHIVSFK